MMPWSYCRGKRSNWRCQVSERIIEQERAKSNQNTLVVDAGRRFQGLPISNSTKGEAREILNQMHDAMAVGNHEFDFGLDEVKKYKEILKFPLLSFQIPYVNGARLFEALQLLIRIRMLKVMICCNRCDNA